MSKKVGLWVDHRKANIVMITHEGEEQRVILSNVEKQLRRSGDSPLEGTFESEQVPADDSRQRLFTGQLNQYYDEILMVIRDAETILIFGPGEAKYELKERLEAKLIGKGSIELETVDRMTDPQIAAKIRQHFIK